MVFWPAAAICLVCFGLTISQHFPEWGVLIDNIHWTVAFCAAAVLAWLGVRNASPEDRPTRKWFAFGLTLNATGQLVWAFQVVVNWMSFPGPSDFFFVLVAPAFVVGLFQSLRAQTSPSRTRTAILDASTLAVAILALTFALYLPRENNNSAAGVVTLSAYPVTWLGAACVGLIVALTLGLKPNRHWALFLTSVLATGAAWMKWNLHQLDNTLTAGTNLNMFFSVTTLASGVGAMTWKAQPSGDRKWERFCEGILRLLPLLVVTIGALSVAVVWTLPGTPYLTQLSIGIGTAAVVVLAMVRQSVLLTERDRMLAAEDSARESERRFETLFQTAHDAIFIMNDRTFEACNEATLRMFDCTREQILGHSPVEFSPPAQSDGERSTDKAIGKIRAALAGHPQSFEWLHLKFDGTPFNAEVSLNRIEIGGRVLLQAMVRDITERKQAEDALREIQERYEIAIRGSSAGLWDRNVLTNELICTPRYLELLGHPPETKLTYHDFTRALHPDDRGRVMAAVEAHLERHVLYDVEYRLRRADGVYRWFNARGQALWDDHGKPYRMAGSIIDIHERKSAEEALRESEIRLRLAFEAAGLGMMDVDYQTGKAMISLRGLEILGFPPDREVDRNLLRIRVHPDDYEMVSRNVEAGRLAQNTISMEHRIVRENDGQCRWVGVAGRYIYGDDGEPQRYLNVFFDITERRQAEEEIRQLNATLEQRVAERTVELAAKSKELESFCYSVSHDLKAPLRGIEGYGRLLEEDYGDVLKDEGRRFLKNIRTATLQMDQLIEDLLAYSKLERRKLAPTPLALDEVIKAHVGARSQDFEKVRLTIDVPECRVLADPEGLNVALRNLLDNALKFSGRTAEPVIEVRGESSNGKCLLSVKDNGAGFDMRHYGKIFEIFQRLHRTDEFPGTGIGLAMVRKAMERIGGRVWAESEPGQGATFYLEMPTI